jgi:hypothetical protein
MKGQLDAHDHAYTSNDIITLIDTPQGSGREALFMVCRYTTLYWLSWMARCTVIRVERVPLASRSPLYCAAISHQLPDMFEDCHLRSHTTPHCIMMLPSNLKKHITTILLMLYTAALHIA